LINPFGNDAKVDVLASSGVLRVIVHPKPHWFVALLELVGMAIFVTIIYRSWGQMHLTLRILFSAGFISTVLGLLYQMSGTEVIEFDAQKLTISKGVHGWERRREYQVKDCSELEWIEGSENTCPGLKCKVGWRTIKFGEYLSETQAVEILTALQRTLPDVAQRMCSFPEGKKHFITLGLNK
jgi:hypothetical protein